MTAFVWMAMSQLRPAFDVLTPSFHQSSRLYVCIQGPGLLSLRWTDLWCLYSVQKRFQGGCLKRHQVAVCHVVRWSKHPLSLWCKPKETSSFAASILQSLGRLEYYWEHYLKSTIFLHELTQAICLGFLWGSSIQNVVEIQFNYLKRLLSLPVLEIHLLDRPMAWSWSTGTQTHFVARKYWICQCR